jgi:hypothetical protein
MNIAWWNIHERSLERVGGVVQANGSPIRFVHFSGYSPADPHTFSKHQVPAPRTTHEPELVIRELAEEYGAALLARGHGERIGVAYQWAETADGIRLTPTVRSIVRRALLRGKRAGCEAESIDSSIPLAFGPTAHEFRAWLEAPVAGSDEVRFTRAEAGLWDQRPDLRAAFPRRDGADAMRYRQWLDHDPDVPAALPGLAAPRPAIAPEPATGTAHQVYRRARHLAGRVLRPVHARLR